MLAAPPAAITMFQIVSALEGSLAPVECVDRPGTCRRSADCAARKLWLELSDAQIAILKKTTLRTLVDWADSQQQPDYCI